MVGVRWSSLCCCVAVLFVELPEQVQLFAVFGSMYLICSYWWISETTLIPFPWHYLKPGKLREGAVS